MINNSIVLNIPNTIQPPTVENIPTINASIEYKQIIGHHKNILHTIATNSIHISLQKSSM